MTEITINLFYTYLKYQSVLDMFTKRRRNITYNNNF